MTSEQAIRFLESYKPLPDDIDFRQDLLDQLTEVVRYVEENPEPQFILPLLLCMGFGTASGAYPAIVGVLLHYEAGQLIPPLLMSLRSSSIDTRIWSLEVTRGLEIRNQEVLAAVRDCLTASDETEREIAASVIGWLATENDRAWLKGRYEAETSDDVRAALLKSIRRLG